MQPIGIFGCGFSHSTSSTLYKIPKNIIWKYSQPCDINFFVDDEILSGATSTYPNKYAWIVESGSVTNAIQTVKYNYELISRSYKYLFTHSRELLPLADNFVYCPPHGYWPEKTGLYNKTKLISFLTSDKSFVEGHRTRLEWLYKLRDYCDCYGRGINPVERVEDALKDYMFSIALENNPHYISEKVLNNFVLGTCPIVNNWTELEYFFDPRGFIRLDENFLIESLTPELYKSMIPYIKENYKRALKFDIIEDNFLWPYIKKNINK